MPHLIPQPKLIPEEGDPPIRIEEFVGRINTGHESVSIARLIAPAGWSEPAQTPEFREFTIVLSGTLRIEHKDGMLDVKAGQAVICSPGERIRYSTPHDGGADYIAVCVPGFSPETAHREE
jgi:ethanolamine utilization protein EutQ